MKRIWYPVGSKSIRARAIATASSLLIFEFPPWPATLTSAIPTARSATMNDTLDQVTFRSLEPRLGGRVALVEDPATEGNVTQEVSEEDEQHPPKRAERIQALLPRLDERQIETHRPGEEQHPGVDPEQPEDQH